MRKFSETLNENNSDKIISKNIVKSHVETLNLYDKLSTKYNGFHYPWNDEMATPYSEAFAKDGEEVEMILYKSGEYKNYYYVRFDYISRHSKSPMKYGKW